MIKIGITGSNGMLGKDIACLLGSENKYNLFLFDLPEYDITDYNTIKKIIHSSDIIINCAAYTAVDKAEKEADKCHEVNSSAIKKLASAAAQIGRYVIHISTDFVFGDNSNTLLNELSRTNPLGIYGKSKLEGEYNLEKSGADYSIIRVQWTYGKYGNNFISKIIELSERINTLTVVDDQIGSPTSTLDIARAISCFIDKQPKGLFHFAAKGFVSRYETAKFIFETLNLNKNVVPCPSEKFPAPAKRPKNSRFDCSKIDKILDFERPRWDCSLDKFLKKNYSNL